MAALISLTYRGCWQKNTEDGGFFLLRLPVALDSNDKLINERKKLPNLKDKKEEEIRVMLCLVV